MNIRTIGIPRVTLLETLLKSLQFTFIVGRSKQNMFVYFSLFLITCNGYRDRVIHIYDIRHMACLFWGHLI